MNRKLIIGTGLAVLIVLGGLFFLVARPLSTLHSVPTPTPYTPPPRAIEVPAFMHRAQSTMPNQVTTQYNPWGIAVDQQNGYVWVAEPGCEMSPVCHPAGKAVLGKFALSDGSLLQEYTAPTNFSSLLFLAVDASGNVWFTEPSTDAIGEFNPQSTNFIQYATPAGSGPYDLLLDKSGNLWFTEFTGNMIGFFNTQTHALVQNAVPTATSNPYGITMDPQGRIWFTENKANVSQLGSFTPTASGKVTITEHAVNAVQPHLLVADKAGNIWFSEAFAGSVGEYIVADGVTRNYPVSADVCPQLKDCRNSHVSGMALDKNGNIWFSDSLAGRIGYIVPGSGAFHIYNFPAKNVHPHDGLVVDSFNTVWYTEEYGRVLGMLPDAKFPAK